MDATTDQDAPLHQGTPSAAPPAPRPAALSPQEFYQEVLKHPDFRAMLERLARK